MSANKFTGLFVASLTPFKNGAVDLDAIPAYIRYLENVQKVDGVFLNGTSGEALSLTVAERVAITDVWRRETKIVIIAHIGCTSLEDAKALARHAESCKVDAIALTPPTYYKPASVGAYVDFATLVAAEAPSIPFMFYHFPVQTGYTFPLHRVLAAAKPKIPTLCGAKYTSMDMGDLLLSLREYPAVLSGHDEVLGAATAVGATGSIGLTYNTLAPLHRRVAEAVTRGDLTAARSIQLQSAEMVSALQAGGYALIPVFKFMMKKYAGIDMGPPRLPLCPLTAEQEAQVSSILESLPIAAELAACKLN